MSRRAALVVTSALTAFVLITVAAVGLRLGASQASPDFGSGTAAASDLFDAAQLQEREQLYRQRLEEAIARLQEASAEVQRRQALVGAPQGEAGPGLGGDSLLSEAVAVQTAVAYTGGGRVRGVELEREHGVTAYEVKLDRGKVYVDAYTGEVVYSKLPRQTGEDEEHDDD